MRKLGMLWVTTGALSGAVLPTAFLEAQAMIDTTAIVRTVGRALRQGPEAPRGPFIVDTTAAGAHYLIQVVKASGLPSQFVAGELSPSCGKPGNTSKQGSPLLVQMWMDSVTQSRAVVWVELRCREDERSGGAMAGEYRTQIRYLVRRRGKGWVTRGPNIVRVT